MKRWLKILWNVCRVTGGILLFYFIVVNTNGWSIVKHISSTAWLVPLLIALPFLGAAIEAKRLAILFNAQEMVIPFVVGYRVVAIGTFFNFCMLGGASGDFVKLYYLGKQIKGKGVEVITIFLLDRIVTLFSLLLLLCSLALINFRILESHPLFKWLVALAGLGVLFLTLLAGMSWSSRSSFGQILLRIVSKFSFHHFFRRTLASFFEFRAHKVAVSFSVLLSFIGHIALISMFALVGKLMLSQVPGITISFLALLGLFANTLPITPGGLGVGEAAFEGLFLLEGYPGGAQLIIAWRLGMLPLCLLGCIFYVIGSSRWFGMNRLPQH